MSALHISISAETLFHLGNIPISNSILTSLIVTTIVVALAVWSNKSIKMTSKPSGLQNFLEMLVEGLFTTANNITEAHSKTKTIFPFFFSFFIFIILNNWIGLLPGVGSISVPENETKLTHQYVQQNPFIPTANAATTRQETTETDIDTFKPENIDDEVSNDQKHLKAESGVHEAKKFIPLLRAGTADLNTTLALALISVVATQVVGVKYLGLAYFKKFIDLKNPINAFVGILELVSEFSKIISFAFRLFGNVFAGEVLLSVMAFLIPILVPAPFIVLEIFVGAIQAFVFAVLTLVFMNMATHGHNSESHA